MNEQDLKEYLKNSMRITAGMGSDLGKKAIIFKLFVDEEIISAYSIPSCFIKQMVQEND